MSAMKISRFGRVQQWLQFHRQWHVIDAAHQDLFKIGEEAARHLSGKWKPIYHPETDCGDFVVMINCKDVAMKAFGWNRTQYKYNRTYPRSKIDFAAYQIHEYDPCRLAYMATYSALGNNLIRRTHMERLHVFPDAEIPDFLQPNIGNQIRQIQPVARRSDEYTAEERAAFPKLPIQSEDHLLDWHKPLPAQEWHEKQP